MTLRSAYMLIELCSYVYDFVVAANTPDKLCLF